MPADATPAQHVERIADALDRGDPDLNREFQALAADHLEVLAGDVDEPNLGLDGATWNRLADNVDLIVHPAALVNHVLPYSQLFGPNVVGTAEVIRLALTSKLKPVNYVSTVAVAFSDDRAYSAKMSTFVPQARCARSMTRTPTGMRTASGPARYCCGKPTICAVYRAPYSAAT